MMLEITLHGSRFIFIGDNLKDGGAITTREVYQRGEMSYAHLYPNGNISQFGRIVGTLSDITDVKLIPDVKGTPEGAANLLPAFLDGGW